MLTTSVRSLADEFDDFIVDLWGVVHDGREPFDGVVDALERLAADPRDKRVLFVTNTSRSADAVCDRLEAIGIRRSLFSGVVSSGEVTRAALQRRDPALFGGLLPSPRCAHYGEASFVPWLFEVGLDVVESLDDGTHLIVVSGAPRSDEDLGSIVARLEPLARRDVPLVCTNPDRRIPQPEGRAAIGPGAVAGAYEALGGRVFLYGKPHPPIYEEARRRLGPSERRAVAIGDLVETDIRGARGAGLPSVLVTRDPFTPARDEDAPDFTMPRFGW